MKFYQNIWNGFQLTELTRVHGRNGYFQYLLRSKGGNSKSRLTRAKILVFCTSSLGALHIWEISWKYLKRFSTYRADTSTWYWYFQSSKGNNSKSRQTRVTVHKLCKLSHKALDFCEFLQNIWNSFQLTERTFVRSRNVVFLLLLLLLFFLCCFFFFFFVFFFTIFTMFKGCYSKGRLTRVIILVFYSLSHCVLHKCEISRQYLQQFLA